MILRGCSGECVALLRGFVSYLQTITRLKSRYNGAKCGILCYIVITCDKLCLTLHKVFDILLLPKRNGVINERYAQADKLLAIKEKENKMEKELEWLEWLEKTIQEEIDIRKHNSDSRFTSGVIEGLAMARNRVEVAIQQLKKGKGE